jgi:hypothetical protein
MEKDNAPHYQTTPTTAQGYHTSHDNASSGTLRAVDLNEDRDERQRIV